MNQPLWKLLFLASFFSNPNPPEPLPRYLGPACYVTKQPYIDRIKKFYRVFLFIIACNNTV